MTLGSLGFTPEEIHQALETNEAFGSSALALQTSWDSTSLGAFKFCARRYFYETILGWIPRKKNIDLNFGILVHSGIERYHKLRALETPHDEALRAVVREAQIETWDRAKGRPEVWDDPAKNRVGLLRLLVWYLDRWKEDPLETQHYDDGRPMVEVNFSISLPYYAGDETFSLCGYFDRLAKFQGDYYVPDIKTTRHQLDAKYFAQFTPDNQFTIYSIASRVALDRPAKGVIVDACQVGATFARFERQFIPRSEEQLEEWMADLPWWLERAQEYAEALYWPMNDRMCWNCPFQPVCARPPAARRAWLEANFTKRLWDPTKKRGDI